MLRKEDFPKEPIEILKDVLPSEEFKKLASLNQERLRCMAEADGLMGEVIEIESKLLVQLNKIRSIEAEIMLKSTSPKMQEADRACAYELINDSCIHESAEVRAYQAGLLPLRKEYPEQCHPSNKSEKLNRASLFATNAWRLRLSIRKKYPNLFLFGQHRYQSPFSDRLYPVSVGRQPSLRSKAFQLFHNGCKSTA